MGSPHRSSQPTRHHHDRSGRDRQNVRLKRFQFAEIGVVDAHADEATHFLDGNLHLRLFRRSLSLRLRAAEPRRREHGGDI